MLNSTIPMEREVFGEDPYSAIVQDATVCTDGSIYHSKYGEVEVIFETGHFDDVLLPSLWRFTKNMEMILLIRRHLYLSRTGFLTHVSPIGLDMEFGCNAPPAFG